LDENCIIPPPINLNCWKHHAGFIKKQISSVKDFSEVDLLKKYLLRVGESQMDLYSGRLFPEEIAQQVVDSLNRKKTFSLLEYRKWLDKKDKKFRLVVLKDRSVWTLRLGENPERYVHIHPGRYSPNTVRVKAATLKTAILVLALDQLRALKVIDTESVNNIRKNYLNEPPLKSLSKASGLRRLLDLFRNKL
jgi:hypothetical protein